MDVRRVRRTLQEPIGFEFQESYAMANISDRKSIPQARQGASRGVPAEGVWKCWAVGGRLGYGSPTCSGTRDKRWA